jgi:hypothetical protein
VESAWRLAKKSARVENRKGDWFFILRLTLRALNVREGMVNRVPESYLNSPEVECLGFKGVVTECQPTYFCLETENGKVIIPLFSLVL